MSSIDFSVLLIAVMLIFALAIAAYRGEEGIKADCEGNAAYDYVHSGQRFHYVTGLGCLDEAEYARYKEINP